jgi:hypothetical protein
LGRKESKAREYLQRQGYPLQTLLQLPERQAAAESQPRPSLESLAQPTRDALADAFEWIGRLAERSDLRADLRALGSGIAHYVYLWDALEDFEDDRRSGRFNALMAIWGPAFPPAEVRALLLGTLASLEQSLGRLPLGSRRKLVGEVVESMRAQTLRHPDLRQKGLAPPSLRARQSKAGFLRTADTDCDCCDCCCEVGCCDHGREGCNCCEISCCDEKLGDSCCEFDCCDCFCCCHNQRVGRGSPCGQSLFRGIRSLFEAPASPSSEVPDDRLCPACRFETVELRGQSGAHRCSNCGGIWVDGAHSGKDIDLKPLTDPKHKVRPPGIARSHRHCPRCQVLLSPAVDPARPETCPECQGRFYERPLDSRHL